VGPAELLRGLGVHLVADLPGVGENLQDHLEVYVRGYGSKQPVSVAPALKLRNRAHGPLSGSSCAAGRGATNHFEGGGFIAATTRWLTRTSCTTSCHRDPLRRLVAGGRARV
jgi:choline dehydrogenase